MMLNDTSTGGMASGGDRQTHQQTDRDTQRRPPSPPHKPGAAHKMSRAPPEGEPGAVETLELMSIPYLSEAPLVTVNQGLGWHPTASDKTATIIVIIKKKRESLLI